MFTKLVTEIRRMLMAGKSIYTATIRFDETPPSAVFHSTLDGFEYVISITPTKAATLNDAGEPADLTPTGGENE